MKPRVKLHLLNLMIIFFFIQTFRDGTTCRITSVRFDVCQRTRIQERDKTIKNVTVYQDKSLEGI
jgi:hypothetical protein